VDVQTETSIFTGTAKLFCTKVEIPETIIKRGERITIRIEGYVNKTSLTGGRVIIGTDPKNRDGTYITPSTDTPVTTTKFDCHLPFKIDN